MSRLNVVLSDSAREDLGCLPARQFGTEIFSFAFRRLPLRIPLSHGLKRKTPLEFSVVIEKFVLQSLSYSASPSFRFSIRGQVSGKFQETIPAPFDRKDVENSEGYSSGMAGYRMR